MADQYNGERRKKQAGEGWAGNAPDQSPDDPEFRDYRPHLGGQERYNQPERQGGRDRRETSYRPQDWEADVERRRESSYAGRGPKGYQRSNERILEEVCERLTQHGQIDATDIEVAVEDGEVTLKGRVNSRREKRMAELVAEEVPGVRDVHNQLLIHNSTRIHEGAGMATGYGKIRSGMFVAGSDGKTVGRIKEVREADFLVDRPMARDVYVPFTAVHTVSQEWLSLRMPGGEVDDQGWPRPDAT